MRKNVWAFELTLLVGFHHMQCAQLMLLLKHFATEKQQKAKQQLHFELLLAHRRPVLSQTRLHNTNKIKLKTIAITGRSQ